MTQIVIMQNDTIKRARENLLNVSYGKFDLIETIFPLDVLLNSRPRQLRKLIAERLELQPDSIPYKTFMSWLSRLKSKNNQVVRISSRPIDGISNNIQKHKGEKDWKAFEASNPSKQEMLDETLLSYPEYD
jgi:hypothetical protein